MAQAARISAGKDPVGPAASAPCVACTLEGEQKTQKDVAEAARVTEVYHQEQVQGTHRPSESESGRGDWQ